MTFFFAVISASTACSPYPQKTENRTYQIPWLNDDGSYSLQKVQIGTFDEAHRLKGKLVEIIIEPSENGSSLTGPPSVGRFTRASDGTLIPTDFNTLQATALYAHMERLFDLDSKLGIKSAAIWPTRVGIAVNYLDPDDGSFTKNNAFYIGDLNAIIMVPYTNTDLPITMNGGVIAHEHFHQIFQSLVIGNLEGKGHRANFSRRHGCGLEAAAVPPRGRGVRGTEKLNRDLTPPEFNQFLLRAMNEGLADFWGWVYTGDSDFIAHSMRSLNELRSLKQSMRHLWSVLEARETVRLFSEDPKFLTGAAYSLGSQYALFLKRLVETEAAQSKESVATKRIEVAQALLRALPKLSAHFDERFETNFIDPDSLVQALYAEINSVTATSCATYSEFVLDNRAKPEKCKEHQTPPVVTPPPVVAPPVAVGEGQPQ